MTQEPISFAELVDERVFFKMRTRNTGDEKLCVIRMIITQVDGILQLYDTQNKTCLLEFGFAEGCFAVIGS